MPYLRVTRSQFDPAVAGALERPPPTGFHRRHPGTPRPPGHPGRHRPRGGRAITLATFDTREHAAFPQEALGPVLASVLSLGVRVESREVYEVLED
jgi:hypothetical protein